MSPAMPAAAAVPLEEAMDRAAAVLSGAARIALACHVNPDPDAIGSMLGLAGSLQAGGAEVVCSWPNEPLERPRWLDVVGEVAPIVTAREFPPAPDVMVSLDAASADRLAGLVASADRAAELIVIDHHVTNPGFGTINVVDPAASSSAEVAFRLIELLGTPLPDSAAACLYAGIVTDTGRFQYRASTPETLRVAAAIRERDFDHSRLAQLLFEDNTFGYLQVLAVALSRAVLVPEAGRGLVWTYLTREDLAASGVDGPDTDDLIDVVRTAREADVACVIKQQRDGRFKVSLRSRGDTDVGSLAQANGGGGHRLAAGYTSRHGVEGTIAAVVEALGPGA